ncbi:hybrid sensor histidine kinase/response regulator [Phenylobacterium sp.]|uniref:hybrid sensor histidine kinase/response regulator n=1 Tax=Phenylobacterium sp. TaxID=1871053 RepID=UPI002ED80AFF
MRSAAPSLRGRLTLLVLAVLLPAIVAFGVLVWRSYGEQRRLLEVQIVETARALSLVVDRDLRKNEVLLQALASSPALPGGDWAAFDAQARVAARGMDATISLLDPEGFLVASTRAPPGAPMPRVKPEQAGVTVARTREDGARVSNLFRGMGTGLPSIAFDIPAPGPDGGATRIAAVTPATALDHLWGDQDFPARWVGTVLDARGVIVSRNRDAAAFVGREVPAGLLRQVRAAPSGITVGRTMDGVQSVVAWNRSADYGWTFLVSVPEAEVVGAVRRSLALGGAMGLALVIGGAALAALLARDIVRPVERLAETTAAWAAGDPLALAPTRTREIDALQARLGESATVIDAQRRDLLDLNASLEERVTQRTRELAEATERLAQAQKMEAVGRLTGGVAHDFNNLLMAVLGNLDLLGRRLTEPRLLRFVDQARSAAERGAVLTSQLLAFSRRQRLEPRPIDVGAQVRNAIDLLRPTLGFKHTIETRIAADLWPAMADPTQLDLMTVNLTLNARDALPAGGVITLSVSNAAAEPARESPDAPPAGDYVVVAVSDNGEGMTPEVLARAFEPFFTTKPLGKGSGLGLSQVLGLAKQLGGGVDVETAPGEGSTFRVYLPRAEGAERPACEPEPEPDIAALKDLTLLLVDDDPAVRAVAAGLLRDLGCQVTEACDGEAAITALRRAPDHTAAALIDFAMPGFNGGETAAALRALRPDLPVVLMSGYADLDALADAWSGPVLRKPFSRAELARELARATAPGASRSAG